LRSLNKRNLSAIVHFRQFCLSNNTKYSDGHTRFSYTYQTTQKKYLHTEISFTSALQCAIDVYLQVTKQVETPFPPSPAVLPIERCDPPDSILESSGLSTSQKKRSKIYAKAIKTQSELKKKYPFPSASDDENHPLIDDHILSGHDTVDVTSGKADVKDVTQDDCKVKCEKKCQKAAASPPYLRSFDDRVPAERLGNGWFPLQDLDSLWLMRKDRRITDKCLKDALRKYCEGKISFPGYIFVQLGRYVSWKQSKGYIALNDSDGLSAIECGFALQRSTTDRASKPNGLNTRAKTPSHDADHSSDDQESRIESQSKRVLSSVLSSQQTSAHKSRRKRSRRILC
jgi:hypothetical protein